MFRSLNHFYYRLILLIVTLQILLSTVVYAIRPGEIGIPHHQIFTPEDYDSHPQTWEIFQNQDGLIYMANYQDIVEFDGERWTHIVHPDELGPICFYMDKNERLFTGYHNDFGYFEKDDYGFYQYNSLFKLLPDSLSQIHNFNQIVELNNEIYFATMNEIIHYNNNIDGTKADSIFVINLEGENFLGRLFIVNGKLFLNGLKKGIYELINNKLNPVVLGPPFEKNTIWSMFENDNNYLLVSNSVGLIKLDNDKTSILESETSDFSVEHHGNFSIQLDENLYALGSRSGGLIFYDEEGKIHRRFTANMGLESNLVNRPGFVDNQQGLWVPNNGGLARIETSSPLEIFHDHNEQKESTLNMTRYNGVFYAAADQGIFKLGGVNKETHLSQWEKIEGIRHLGWGFSHFPDRLLIAVANGLFEYFPEKNETRKIEGLNNCLSVTSSLDSQYVYAGTWINGLRWYELQGKELLPKGQIEGSGNYIRHLITDNSGDLWYTVEGKHIEKVHPVYSENGNIVDHTLTIYDSTKGLFTQTNYDVVIWENQITVGSEQGLYRYNAERDSFVIYDEYMALFSPDSAGCEGLTVDRKDRLWCTTEAHLVTRILRKNGTLIRETPVKRSNIGKFYYLYPEKDEDVFWVSSIDGTVYRYDESKVIPDTVTFKPLIRKVILANDSILNANWLSKKNIPVNLSSDLSSFRIEFALPRYDELHENQYRFRMIGLDEEWSEWTDENYRDFNNLFEGYYRFEVQGRDVYKKISETAAFSFRVHPPWFRSVIAYVMYFLAFVSMIYLIIKWQLRKSELERLRLEKLVKQRTTESLEQFKRATEAEHESQRLKDITMLSTALAHEFNNPMAIIKVTTELLQMKYKNDESTSSKLEKINSHIERMSELVDHLVNIQSFKTTDYAGGHEMLDIKRMSEKSKKNIENDPEK